MRRGSNRLVRSFVFPAVSETSKKELLTVFFIMGCILFCACATAPLRQKSGSRQVGTASWYGRQYHGRKTASGEIFNMNDMTAAHPTLPFGTMVRVTNLRNGLSIVVRINDRGPFLKSRIIDLSYAAAKEVRMIQRGIVKVEVLVLE